MTDLDETALLGGDLGSDQLFTGDIIDEDELLGLNDQKSQNSANGDNAPAPVLNTSISNEETEQLDYDEDDETEKKPRDKFSSEKKQENFGTDNPNNQKSGAKCFVNPKFQNRLPNSGNSQSPLPSLMSQTIPPPMPQMMPNPVDYNVRMVMMNSLRPIVPPNPMMRPMGLQGFPMQNPGMPPMSMPNQPPGPITAQIGQLSTVIQQQQDGTITFRTTIPQNQPPRVTIARAGCSEQGPNKDWDSMVDEFIKGGSSKSRKRERRSRSNSSKSRSISNSSYSGSYTGDSYSSRSDYSRSPSPYRRRRNRSPDRKRRSHRHGSYRRHRHERTRRSPRRHRDSKNDLKNTMECAEAVGLDSEYVRKLEEQKKLREEVARQKYQRDGRDRKDARRPETSTQHRRVDEERSRSKSDARPAVQTQQSSGDNKVKPYLVVVINNLINLSDAYKRLKMIAMAVGPTKKVWQTSDDSVSIIFEHHEHAKNFMLQYHMKQFNGITLNIQLEKLFLNLASIP